MYLKGLYYTVKINCGLNKVNTKIYPQILQYKHFEMTKTDSIKARLEYLKLILTSLFGALFLLYLYQVQYPDKATYNIIFGYGFIAILIIAVSCWYFKKSDELIIEPPN